MQIPLLGGTCTVSIVETHSPPKAGGGPFRTPVDRVLADLQEKSKAPNAKPSDQVEGLALEVKWEPMKGALGVIVSRADMTFPEGELAIVSHRTLYTATD